MKLDDFVQTIAALHDFSTLVLIILCVYVFLRVHRRFSLSLFYYYFFSLSLSFSLSFFLSLSLSLSFALYNLAYIDFYRLIGKLSRVQEEARDDEEIFFFKRERYSR